MIAPLSLSSTVSQSGNRHYQDPMSHFPLVAVHRSFSAAGSWPGKNSGHTYALLMGSGCESITVQRIERLGRCAIALLRRVTNTNHGLDERDRLQLVHSFFISRLIFTLPYIRSSKVELSKIDGLICKVYRAALQLPPNASTDRLLQLGVFNTATELVEPHLTSQRHRL